MSHTFNMKSSDQALLSAWLRQMQRMDAQARVVQRAFECDEPAMLRMYGSGTQRRLTELSTKEQGS